MTDVGEVIQGLLAILILLLFSPIVFQLTSLVNTGFGDFLSHAYIFIVTLFATLFILYVVDAVVDSLGLRTKR